MPAKFLPKPLEVRERQPRSWVWRNRIPQKKVTLISGDWGSGKTHAVCSVLAHIFNREEFPDGEAPEVEPGHVFIITTESDTDELAEVLLAQGVSKEDIESYIHVLDYLVDEASGQQVAFDLDKDLKALEEVCRKFKPILLVFDPLVEFHSRKEVDSHAIRGLMMRLNVICERLNVAILALIHWNKNEKLGNRNRTAGSHQYAAGVKSVITVYRDTKVPNTRHFDQEKMTLGPEPVAIAFTIEPPDGMLVWGKVEGAGQDFKIRQAEEWLLSHTAEGPMPIKECIEKSGFAERTLRRARSNLGHQILTREIEVDGRPVIHWDLSCERNLWGAFKLQTSEPSL